MKKYRLVSNVLWAMCCCHCLFIVSVSANVQYAHDPKVMEELRIRDGFANLMSKLDGNRPVTIAYLGGSITNAEGWRNKTFSWLKSQYPNSRFAHVNAGIGGTPSDFGSMRLQRDVLRHKPDLVFVEFRVNSGGGVGARSIEGIIRQIWQDDPTTDICLVYTIARWMVSGMEKGNQQQKFGSEMEVIANYYGIPSIDFAPEVIKQKKAGSLIFQAQKSLPDQLHFSIDGVHPVEPGHDLYAKILTRSFAKISNRVSKEGWNKNSVHILRPPLNKNHAANAGLIPITEAKMSEGWHVVDSDKDTGYLAYQGGKRTAQVLSKAFKTNRLGASYVVKWVGTRLSLTSIQQKGTEILVSTDGATPTSYVHNRKEKHMAARLLNLKELEYGKHSTTITINQLPKNTRYYAGQFGVLRPPNIELTRGYGLFDVSLSTAPVGR